MTQATSDGFLELLAIIRFVIAAVAALEIAAQLIAAAERIP